MRASVLYAAGELGLEDRPDPVPGPFEVVVRVSAVGVCGSDVHYFEHGRIGSFTVTSPLVLGHEAAGTVVGVGSSASRLEVGQRVSLEPGVPDLSCGECLAGRYNLCLGMRFFATPPIDGAFAELVAIHEQFAHPVPDSLSNDAAALLEPLSVGLWACRKGHVGPGSRVLVTGAGPVGLVAAQSAMALGAAEVTITDVNPQRLDAARELGISNAVDVSTTSIGSLGVEPDVVLECSGNPAATGEAVGVLVRNGTVVLVGMGSDELALPISRIQERELTVTGTFRYAHTWPAAIALAASGRVQLDRLVTGHYGLDNVEAALTATKVDPAAIKPIVQPCR